MNITQTSSLVTIALASSLLVAGCSSGGAPVPAAGSGRTSSTASVANLRFAFTPGLADAHVEALQAEVAARTDSGVALTMDEPVDVQDVRDAEQQIVSAVAEGRIDLALVGARVFSQIGVHDLDALIAPMALPSVAAQEAVWSTDVVERMLDGLEEAGVDGLAAYPGPTRRPVAAGEPITSAADFKNVPFFVWDGDVNEMTIDALGATTVEVTAGERNAGIEDGSILAFDNTLLFMSDKTEWATRAMSLNIDLWPSVSVLVANPDTLDELSTRQRDALFDAVDATNSSAFDRLPDEQALVNQACANGFTFGLARPEELATIEAALEPVRERLRTDATVAAFLDEIAILTRDAEAVVPAVPDDCDGKSDGTAAEEAQSPTPTGEPTELDGSYAVTWSVEDLIEALGGADNPAAAQDAQNNAGTIELTFDRGRYDMFYVESGDSCPGTYVVDGDRVVLTATSRPTEWDCGDGLGQTVADVTWSVVGGELTLTDWTLSPTPDMGWFTHVLLGTKPLARVEQ